LFSYQQFSGNLFHIIPYMQLCWFYCVPVLGTDFKWIAMRRRLCGLRILKALGFSVLFLFGKLTIAGETESVYWYVNGKKVAHPVSKNTIAYKTSGSEFDASALIHDEIIHSETVNQFGKNIIKLHVASNYHALKNTIEEQLKKHNVGAQPLMVINYVVAPGLPEKEIFFDNQLLVKFSESFITRSAIEQFKAKYNLELIHQPSENLPQYGNYTYIFALRKEQTIQENAATMAAKIFEENAGIIKEVVPNMLNMFEPTGDGSMLSASWHLSNQGQTNFCSVQGQQVCDTRIMDVWNLGYTGQGIKVGVIDVHGFDFSHPDLIGRFLNGWDFINNRALTKENATSVTSNQSHGMAVAGIIAAKSSQSSGATGVAYNSKIVPFLVDLSDASIIQALQKAMSPEFDVDIINCSFSGTGNNPLIEAEINNLTQYGRNRFGAVLGVVVVCSAGNDNMSDEFVPYYPAYYNNVINVTATTPEDRKKDFYDKWNTGSQWAPNYGRKVFVAAPGICIPTTDFSGSAGYSSSNYISFSRTSSSAPIVAGLAALLLSKNAGLTFDEVKQKIADGAEKIGGYNYSYDADKPGHSKETGYGRINAYNTLEGVSVGINEISQEKKIYKIVVENPAASKLHINYDTKELKGEFSIFIFDLSGNLLNEGMLPKNNHQWVIDIDGLPAGMYISQFYNSEERISVSARFIKLW
jgi:subtilisin family serine protease